MGNNIRIPGASASPIQATLKTQLHRVPLLQSGVVHFLVIAPVPDDKELPFSVYGNSNTLPHYRGVTFLMLVLRLYCAMDWFLLFMYS